jgi:hypothetical protein
MTMITFIPVSADSHFGVQISDNPRQERSEISWRAVTHPDNTVSLEDGNRLNGIECTLSLRVGEPLHPTVYRATWDYAHGFIKWFGGENPCLISLQVSAATFAPLRDMAARGTLPSVHLTFKDDRGIAFDGSPDGDVLWQNSKQNMVPAHEILIAYAFGGGRLSNTQADD